MFLAHHVDEEASLREHRESTDAALLEARRQVRSAEERLTRLKTRWRDGEIDTKLWEYERAELEADRDAAISACVQLSSRVAQAEADGELADTVSSLKRTLDEIRNAASAEAVDAFRAAMATLFEGAILIDLAALDIYGHTDAVRIDGTAVIEVVAIGRDALAVQLIPHFYIAGALDERGYFKRVPGRTTLSANVSLTWATHFSDCRYASDLGRRRTSALRSDSRNSSGPSKRRILRAPVPTP